MKILVIQQKMIGDVLTSSILFEALRQHYPQAELHYLIQPHTRAVVQNNPHIDHLVFSDSEQHNTLLGFWKFSTTLNSQQYDLVIDVYAKISSALLSMRTGAKRRISYYKWYTSGAYTDTVVRNVEPRTKAGLAIDHRMALLKPLDADFPEVLKPSIYLQPEEIVAGRKQLEKMGVNLQQPVIMVNILGSSPAKTYPGQYMAQVLAFMVKAFNLQILLNYIPSQKTAVEQVYDYCTEETKKQVLFDLCGANLREFLAIISHCDALVGNEGGAINMAKALEVPTFAIFSPQIEKKTWSIFEDNHTNVAVHLSDFHTELLKGKTTGEITKNSQFFYKEFKPEYLYPKLRKFLESNT